MNILGMVRLGANINSGGGSGSGLTVTTATLDSNGETNIAVSSANTKTVVSMQFVNDTAYLSVLERFNNSNTSAIYVRSTAGAADSGEQIVVAYQ